MTTRTTNALGFLAAALLFLSMFAGLFGAFGSTAPERQCWSCGRSGHWWGYQRGFEDATIGREL